MKRNKHPREAIRRQQEIREDIRLVGQDITELKTSYEQELKKKKVRPHTSFRVSDQITGLHGTEVTSL